MGKKPSVVRGQVPMLVGRGKEMKRFLVQTKILNHPCFISLLELAALEFGYEQQGILKIPCDIKHFRAVVSAAERTL